jgi:hypothetical protein
MSTRNLSPFPGKSRPAITVEGRTIVITDSSVFGRTSLRMDIATAKHVARLLAIAAIKVDTAPVEIEVEESPPPKLAAVR